MAPTLGHPDHQTFKFLVANNSISCNKKDSKLLCHACQLGKHTGLSFDMSQTHAYFSFQVIHSDVWTSPLQSNGGIRYYVIFLDQFSHFLWVYLLRRKYEVFSKFLHFHTYVKNLFHITI